MPAFWPRSSVSGCDTMDLTLPVRSLIPEELEILFEIEGLTEFCYPTKDFEADLLLRRELLSLPYKYGKPANLSLPIFT